MTHEQLQAAAEASATELVDANRPAVGREGLIALVRDTIIRHLSHFVGEGSVCIQTSPTEIIPTMIVQCAGCGAAFNVGENGALMNPEGEWCPKCAVGKQRKPPEPNMDQANAASDYAVPIPAEWEGQLRDGAVPREPMIVTLQNPRQPQPEVKREWKCEYCGSVYAEYINGCPKCWMGEVGTASSVRLVEKPQPEVKVEWRTVWLMFNGREGNLFYEEVFTGIPIPLIKHGNGPWELDAATPVEAMQMVRQAIAAKDAEISRLTAEVERLEEVMHKGRWFSLMSERDAALQRAEAAEAKLDERAALREQVAKLERVVEAVMAVRGETSDAVENLNAALAALERKV